MVIEDIHWADEATLDLVKFLGRRIGPLRSMLVLTYRDAEAGTALRRTLGDLPPRALKRLSLLPLSEAAIGELARQAGRTPAGLYAATGGNPQRRCGHAVPI
jgi:predicted ATPase